MTTSNVEHPLSAEYPKVVARAEWLAARKALLAKEKELTRYRDTANAERRRLPMVRIDKEYLFDGPDGKASVLELFEGHRQLVVYHFMFDPSWDEGCPNCSFRVDNVGHLGHLHARDSDKAEVLLKGEAYFTQGESHGLSVFLRGDDSVFHTYSTYARGTDLLAGTYNYVDLTPMGRQEDWEEPPGRSNSAFLAWVRHHDRYEDRPTAAASCCGSATAHA